MSKHPLALSYSIEPFEDALAIYIDTCTVHLNDESIVRALYFYFYIFSGRRDYLRG